MRSKQGMVTEANGKLSARKILKKKFEIGLMYELFKVIFFSVYFRIGQLNVWHSNCCLLSKTIDNIFFFYYDFFINVHIHYVRKVMPVLQWQVKMMS